MESDSSTEIELRPPNTPWGVPSVERLQALLPQYEVLELLGRGGMGAVYKARQKSLQRIVAIKVVPPDSDDAEMSYSDRFRNEACTMAELNRPCIVSVHDFGELSGGLLYFVMEFVDGTDVGQMIKTSGRLSPKEALGIATHVLDALHYAHSHGVIHRDIKPSNILINKDGQVKVADFGLAKKSDPALNSALTRSNTAVGTPEFVAPEAMNADLVVDHRADLYALGVTLYQMLTGEIPRGMFKLPSEKFADIDPGFDEIICKALEPDREDRYQNASDVRSDLDRLSATPATEVRSLVVINERDHQLVPLQPAPPWRHRPRAALAIVGFVSLFTVFGVWLWIKKQDAPEKLAMKHAPSADGWTNVLPLVDLKRHQLDGYWKIINGELVNRFDIGHGVVELPMAPKGAYDLRVRLTCVKDGGGHTNILFRHGAHAGDFSLTDYAAPHAGIVFLDGKKASEHGMMTERLTRFLTLGEPREILLQVRDEGLAVRLDGEEIYRWTGDWAQVTQDTVVIQDRVKDRDVFGIYVHTQRVVVHEVEWRDASGPLPEAPTTAPPKAAPVTRTFPGNGHRYQLMPGAFSWKEANANALSMGGHLATLTSAEENDWAWRTFGAYLPSVAVRNLPTRGWWLGATQEEEGQPWAWVTGETFEFTRWADGQPSRSKPGDSHFYHLFQRDNGGGGDFSSWRASPSTSRGNYLIEWDETDVGAAPPTALFNGHRYQFIPGSYNWTKANEQAVKMGGHLATITSEEENNWVWDTFSRYLPVPNDPSANERGWWLGASRENLEGNWTWVTGEPFAFTHWADGAPSTGWKGANYLRQIDKGTNGKWSAQVRLVRCGFLVEWDSDKPETPSAATAPSPP